MSKCIQSLDSFRYGRRKGLLQLTLKAETTQLMLEAPKAQKQVGKNKAVMQKDVFFLPYNQAWLKMEVLLLHEAP